MPTHRYTTLQIYNMEKRKWKWAIDQWLEDKVWVKVPKEIATPHFFFVLGFATALLLFAVMFSVA